MRGEAGDTKALRYVQALRGGSGSRAFTANQRGLAQTLIEPTKCVSAFYRRLFVLVRGAAVALAFRG